MKIPDSSRRQFLITSSCGLSRAWVALHWPAIWRAHQHAHETAVSDKPVALRFFSTEQAVEVEAIAAQIIPTDDSPGAREAHVVYFIDQALASFDRARQKDYTRGLAQLEIRIERMFSSAGRFSQLHSEQQIRLLTAIQHTRFFELLRLHTVMGFLANPEYGGNYNQVGWKLIGFEDNFYYEPPFGYYDAQYSKATHK